MKNMKGLRAICYHRVSTQDQVDSGAGMEAQEAATAAVCAYKGWEIVAIANDQGKSGKNTDRPGLIDSMKMLDAGDADVLVIAKLDRLSRSMVDFLTIMQRANRNGWDICIKDLDLDTSHQNGRLVMHIMAAIAEWEREMIRERTKAGMAAMKAAGKTIGRPSISTTLKARILKEREQGFTFAQIADRLNSEGVPTPQGGKAWRHSSVRATITPREPKKPRVKTS